MRWMLDTDTCIAFLNPQRWRPSARLETVLLDDVGISSITLAELHAGIAKSERSCENAESLYQLLAKLEIAPFDETAAAVYGAIRARLERRGTPIGPMDLLIAAHAMSANVTLVTHNTREYERLVDLQLEDWLKSATKA
jgi:tRNA(fMet)-specific endonuclease VapC